MARRPVRLGLGGSGDCGSWLRAPQQFRDVRLLVAPYGVEGLRQLRDRVVAPQRERVDVAICLA